VPGAVSQPMAHPLALDIEDPLAKRSRGALPVTQMISPIGTSRERRRIHFGAMGVSRQVAVSGYHGTNGRTTPEARPFSERPTIRSSARMPDVSASLVPAPQSFPNGYDNFRAICHRDTNRPIRRLGTATLAAQNLKPG
jgi:hypothetical protein